METTATQNSIHKFEAAGLGKAPFRIVGVCEKIGPFHYTDQKTGLTVTVGAPGQPMGCCKYCGQGIQECWAIRSADGKQFDVGCECVRKTGDAGMKKVIDAHKAKINREKRNAKGKADREYVESVLADVFATGRLAKMPHPKSAPDKPYFADLNALDFVEYMHKNSGNSGVGRLARWLRAALA